MLTLTIDEYARAREALRLLADKHGGYFGHDITVELGGAWEVHCCTDVHAAPGVLAEMVDELGRFALALPGASFRVGQDKNGKAVATLSIWRPATAREVADAMAQRRAREEAAAAQAVPAEVGL